MSAEGLESVRRYPLLDALRDRRSRRFGVGMRIGGPLGHESAAAPLRLTEDEEGLLAFAACGFTGPVVGDLDYTPEGGGTILASVLGRTVPSGDALGTVSLFVTNDDGAWLLKRPRDVPAADRPALADLARRGELAELYRRSRVRVREGRAAPPLDPLHNLDVNRWSLFDPASTYLLPVGELTHMYVNGLLSVLDERTGAFLVDERAGFRPAGLSRFARRRGGHLRDDPREGRVLTIQQIEALVDEFVTVEIGMTLQNVALMAQAIGLGGFPHWAAHAWGWLEALGFRLREMPTTRYVGAGPLARLAARLLRRDPPVRLALGLEKDGEPLLTPYCPPWYPSMEAAVAAVVDFKFGPHGALGGGAFEGLWRDPGSVAAAARPPSQATVDATVAYCEYVVGRYGRFPAYAPPFRTVLGYQASHVDLEYYERRFRPGAVSETQRRHVERWHPSPGALRPLP
jgi:hypothetical protein